MKNIVITAIMTIATVFATAAPAAAHPADRTARDLPIYEEIAQAFDDEIAPPEKVFATDDLTAEILQNRVGCGYVIVEKLISVCLNETGDGRVINTKKRNNNYVSFRRTYDYCTGKRIHKGDVVLTYLIYNPNNNYIDDIVERVDYIIDTATFR
jgi:hypothetical protein